VSLSIHQVAVDCKDPSLLSVFWAEVLGYAREDWGKQYGALVYGADDRGVRIVFLGVPELKVAKNRVHLDVRTRDNSRDAEVQRLVGLGAREIETKSISAETGRSTWTIMLDPEGNEFCVSAAPTAQ